MVVGWGLVGCESDVLTTAPVTVFIDGGVASIDGGVFRVDGGVREIDGGVAQVDGGTAFIDGGRAFIDGGVVDNDGGTAFIDGGVREIDGGIVRIDGGAAFIDGGVREIDGGIVDNDGGTAFIDGGVREIDGGIVRIDGGVTTIDGGVITIDAGSTPLDPPDGPVSVLEGSQPTLLIDDTGELVLFYTQARGAGASDVAMATYSGAWSPTVVLTDFAIDANAAVVDADGTFHLGARPAVTGALQYVRGRRGSNFTGVPITVLPGRGNFAVALDADGGFHITSNVGLNPRHYATNASGAFVASQIWGNTTGVAALALTPSGPAIAYGRWQASAPYLAHGPTWTQQDELEDYGPDQGPIVRIAQTSSGLRVAYAVVPTFPYETGDVAIQSNESGSLQRTAVRTNVARVHDLDLTVGPSGRSHIVQCDREDTLYYSTDVSGTWATFVLQANECRASGIDSVHRGGRLYVAYQNTASEIAVRSFEPAVVAGVAPPDVVVSPTQLDVTEGGTATVAVSLASAPGSDVTVAITSGDLGAVGASPASLVFTPSNWQTPQVATLAGVQDADFFDEQVTLQAQIGTATPTEITVFVFDDDDQQFVLSTQTLTLIEGEPGATITAALAFDPVTLVTTPIVASDPTLLSVTPSPLNFNAANYLTPQAVTISAWQDSDACDDSAQVTLSAPLVPTATIDVMIIDDDQQWIELDRDIVSLLEGDTTTVNMRLVFEPCEMGPTAQVTAISSDAFAATPSGAPLTFTAANHFLNQPLTITAPHDADSNDEVVTITVSTLGAPDRIITVLVTDDRP